MKLKKKNGWTTEEISPCRTHNDLYNSYVAKIVSVDDKGNESRIYMEKTNWKDFFYDVSPLCAGDIIVASLHNPVKNKQTKRYYVVESNTGYEITLRGGDKNGVFNTYDKLVKSLSSTQVGIDNTIKTQELF